jgi:hypothetical protein
MIGRLPRHNSFDDFSLIENKKYFKEYKEFRLQGPNYLDQTSNYEKLRRMVRNNHLGEEFIKRTPLKGYQEIPEAYSSIFSLIENYYNRLKNSNNLIEEVWSLIKDQPLRKIGEEIDVLPGTLFD